jgi:CRISPR-associated protein Cas1
LFKFLGSNYYDTLLIVKNATIKKSGSDLIISWDNSSKQVSTLDLEMLIIVDNNVICRAR